LPPSYLPLSQNSPKLRAQKAGILPEARPGEGRSGPGMAPETPEGRHEGDQRCRGVGASSEQSSTRDPTQDAVRPGVGLKADSSARSRCPEPCFAAPSQAPVGHIGGKRAVLGWGFTCAPHMPPGHESATPTSRGRAPSPRTQPSGLVSLSTSRNGARTRGSEFTLHLTPGWQLLCDHRANCDAVWLGRTRQSRQAQTRPRREGRCETEC
jgi:hypothetical protein